MSSGALRTVQSPNSPNVEQPYWQPGVALPITTPSRISHPFYNPPVRQLQIDDGDFGSNSLEGTLKSILSSQKEIQKQMDNILSRVDVLEDTVKTSSLSSSTSDEKKTARLSSELCVSI